MPQITIVQNTFDDHKYTLKFSKSELDSIFNPYINKIIAHNNQKIYELYIKFDGKWYVEILEDGKIYKLYIDEDTEFVYEPKNVKRNTTKVTPFGTFEIPYTKGLYNIPYIQLENGKYLAFTILSYRNEDIFAQYIKETEDKYIEYLKEIHGDIELIDLDDW